MAKKARTVSACGRPSAFAVLADEMDNGDVSTVWEYRELKRGDKSNGCVRVRQMLALYNEKGQLSSDSSALEVVL